MLNNAYIYKRYDGRSRFSSCCDRALCEQVIHICWTNTQHGKKKEPKIRIAKDRDIDIPVYFCRRYITEE